MPLFEIGRQAFADAAIDFNTDTIKDALVRLTTADTMVKAVTGATNATPIVITATAHGFTNGDLVLIGDVGGNLSANGIFRIANTAANTFELQYIRADGVAVANAAGSGAYTSGGWAVNLSALDFLDDIDGCVVGTAVTLTSPTITNGVLDAADPTFSSVAAGAAIQGHILYKDTGSAATSRAFFIDTGRFLVRVAANAASSATSITVDQLEAPIASGQQIAFSNGVVATLSGAAAIRARTLSVNALSGAINAEHVGSALKDTSPNLNFPITPNGGNITITFDAAGIVKI